MSNNVSNTKASGRFRKVDKHLYKYNHENYYVLVGCNGEQIAKYFCADKYGSKAAALREAKVFKEHAEKVAEEMKQRAKDWREFDRKYLHGRAQGHA